MGYKLYLKRNFRLTRWLSGQRHLPSTPNPHNRENRFLQAVLRPSHVHYGIYTFSFSLSHMHTNVLKTSMKMKSMLSTTYINYFSLAVIKHQSNLQKNEFIGLRLQRVVGVHHGGRQLEQKAECSHLQAGTEIWERGLEALPLNPASRAVPLHSILSIVQMQIWRPLQ